MCNRDECIIVNGPYMNTAPLRKGAPATILGDFVRRYHVQCDPVTSAVWGWSATNDVANSNHLSGTAVDINAPKWPWGYRKMPAELVNRINNLLAFYEGAVFWGRNWNKPDEMHFQMGWPEGDKRYDRIIAKITGSPVPTTPSAPAGNYYAKRGDKNGRVLHLQIFMNANFKAYSKLVEDGDFGPATESVIKEFQRRTSIDVDGIVGPQTLAKLKSVAGFVEVPVNWTKPATGGSVAKFPEGWSDREIQIEILRQLRGPNLDGWDQLEKKSVVDKLDEVDRKLDRVLELLKDK
ncbi:peptidoglycan-binding protein [Mycolicibacterium phlei]|uniref:peptidoglycan-binding protein n=1 Tax=Mycolicibacterium phlei TaxID=1771 RepID=UPI001E3F3D55|nr:peptidoglycan-binding protein [Mycolicibacterium phlei]MBF4194686.1 hypothetical protein [Mycolicibacterium phlei]